MIAICLRGPAGAGKTTIAYELGRALRQRGCIKGMLGYISADMFAHISLDCQYAEPEVDLKYHNIELVIRNLASNTMDVIYDDTYRRTRDYDFIERLLQDLGYRPIYKFFVFVPLDVALRRNSSRFWKERLPDELIISHHRFHEELVGSGEIQVDALLEVGESVRLMLDAIAPID